MTKLNPELDDGIYKRCKICTLRPSGHCMKCDWGSVPDIDY